MKLTIVGRAVLVIALACAGLAIYLAAAPSGNPPREVVEKARPALREIQQGLAAEDKAAVRLAVNKAIVALGPWAGIPETPTRYYGSKDTTAIDIKQARIWWHAELKRGNSDLLWLANPPGDPKKMTAGLRAAAIPLDSLARSAALYPDQREELTKQVRAGADWLLKLQHPSGLFPFPIGPGLNPQDKVGRIVARAVKEHPEIVVNDWLIDDLTDGGLQFDNGLCGRALVSAWELTQDAKYLAAARKSGDWASNRPLVSNWNYNGFRVGLLARLFQATGDLQYLNSAVRKAEVGVLPGQMPSGRWFDAHNASAVYHNIIQRDLLELYHVLPVDHSLRPELLDALTRGLNQAADETIANGFTGTWTENFARGLLWIGENAKWRKALQVNLHANGQGEAPSVGFDIVAVLEEHQKNR